MADCECSQVHTPRRVVLTGGPGAGKTAVLELVRRSLCRHVRILPESAGVVFGGGFPRDDHAECRRAAQRAIYHVQKELETAGDAHAPAIVLCDRGTIDGLAYWPGPPDNFWSSTGTTMEAELGRYDTVLHLRTPTAQQGYNHQNPLRTESAPTAAQVDARILEVWQEHPQRHIIESTRDFLDKATHTLDLLQEQLPTCCSGHLRISAPGQSPGPV
ncbi:MAG: ATP-binding protein [Nocardioides sp.]|nr:ATP-binding protein [Nocardioides sp.]